MTRFWQALDRMAGHEAVRAEWFRWLGDDIGAAQPYLTPTRVLATSFPHPKSGLALEVIEHANGDFVAVDEAGYRLALSRPELAIYRVDFKRLVEALSNALKMGMDASEVPGDRRTWRIGTYEPLAGFSYPAYLTVQTSCATFEASLVNLSHQSAVPVIVLAPTKQFVRLQGEQFFQKHAWTMLALADVVDLGPKPGTLMLNEVGELKLREFQKMVLPAATETITIFLTPTGCQWSDLRMKFVDGQTLSIKVGGATGILNYTQMGMIDERTTRPDKQWMLLREFARGRGMITWPSRKVPAGKQKQKEKLAETLQSVFHMPGMPIELSKQKTWQTAFHIETDA